MLKFSVLILICLPLSVLPDPLRKAPAKNEDWDYLILAQFWPPTSCVYFKESGCVIPPDVTDWTIHGLWPAIPGSEKPQFCNDSMKFNADKIKSLRPKLDVKWPYYNKTGDRTDLWAHEWDKHGTCAYTLPALQGELKYFNKTMALYSNRTLDIFRVLTVGDIVPSTTRQYTRESVFKVINSGYGKIPIVACLYDKEENATYLEQVWRCYDKEFNLRDCPGVSHHLRAAWRTGQRNSMPLLFKSEDPPSPDLPLKSENYFLDCGKHNMLWYKPINRTSPKTRHDWAQELDIIEEYNVQSEQYIYHRRG